MKGIDVSSWQGEIDWQKVKNAGIDFAIIRVAAGQAVDKTFHYNIAQAKLNDILVGVYLYTKAKTAKDIDRELKVAFNALNGYSLDLPFFWDLEDVSLRNMNKQTLTLNLLYALSQIESRGYKAGVYSNPDWLTYVVDYKSITGYPLWLACWTSEERRQQLWDKPIDLWQYGLDRVNGIKGDVDVDILYNEKLIQKTVKVKKVKIANCLAAWIRTNPNSNSKAIGCALRGQEFVSTGQVVRMQNVDWLRIKSGSAYGWIGKKFTKEV